MPWYLQNARPVSSTFELEPVPDAMVVKVQTNKKKTPIAMSGKANPTLNFQNNAGERAVPGSVC